MNTPKPALGLVAVLFLVANSSATLAADLGIRTSSSLGQVEIFFAAAFTNDYRIHRGDCLTNLSVVETVSGASGVVSRQYPATGTAGFFMLDCSPTSKPLPGFGVIMGTAFLLDAELTNSSPYLFSNTLDFADNPFDTGIDDPLLTAGGQILLASAAGGSSLLAQVFAFEVLARTETATLLKSGMEILYKDPGGKKTSFLVAIDGVKIGVSVTRAVTFPRGSAYTAQMAETLLTTKLADISGSSANVAAADAWEKQILLAIADEQAYVDTLQTAWAGLSPSLKADTIVLITVTLGADGFLY